MALSQVLAASAILCCGAACLRAAWRPGRCPEDGGRWRAVSALAFILNVVAVSLPGRFDSDPGAMLDMPQLLAPAPWAFAIWAVIYLGELVGLAWTFVGLGPEDRGALSRAAPAWCAGNVAQCLWCAAFRPWARQAMWLSAALLGTTAACLLPAQLAAREVQSRPAAALVVLPRSLHLGWATAATLVNINGYVGVSCGAAAAAWLVALSSVAVGVLAGAAYARRGLPAAAGAVCWALWACSCGQPMGGAHRELWAGAMQALHRAEAAGAGLLSLAVAAAWLRGRGGPRCGAARRGSECRAACGGGPEIAEAVLGS